MSARLALVTEPSLSEMTCLITFTTTSQTVTVIMTAAGVVLGAVLWMYQKKRNEGVAAA